QRVPSITPLSLGEAAARKRGGRGRAKAARLRVHGPRKGVKVRRSATCEGRKPQLVSKCSSVRERRGLALSKKRHRDRDGREQSDGEQRPADGAARLPRDHVGEKQARAGP